MRPTTTKNAMLDGVTFTHVSVHSGFPGLTGANEITDSRVAVSVAAASGGIRALAAVPSCSIGAATTVRWFGFWNGSTFVDMAPNGGAVPRNFMSVGSTDLIYSSGHGYTDTQKIVFFGDTPPGGLTEGTVYFVRDATTDTFKVAATSGGAAIDLTTGPGFGCVVSAIVEDVYAGTGSHDLSALTFTVPG